MRLTSCLRSTEMKKILFVLLAIVSLSLTACLITAEEEVVNIRVHGYVRDKATNDPLPGCGVYISNGYIDEADERAGETDINGYYDFNRDVWAHYQTVIDVFCGVNYKSESPDIDNNPDSEVNFYLEKY